MGRNAVSSDNRSIALTIDFDAVDYASYQRSYHTVFM